MDWFSDPDIRLLIPAARRRGYGQLRANVPRDPLMVWRNGRDTLSLDSSNSRRSRE
jgi:hypothetical protein